MPASGLCAAALPSHAAPSSSGHNRRARFPRRAIAVPHTLRNTSARASFLWSLPPFASFSPCVAKQKALRGAQDLQHLTGLADRDWPVLLFSYVRLFPRSTPPEQPFFVP